MICPGRLKTAAKKRDSYLCQKCGRKDGLQGHHLSSWWEMGLATEEACKEASNTIDNIITLCSVCHTEWHSYEKGSKQPFKEWLKEPTLLNLLAFWKSFKEMAKEVDISNLSDIVEATENAWLFQAIERNGLKIHTQGMGNKK